MAIVVDDLPRAEEPQQGQMLPEKRLLWRMVYFAVCEARGDITYGTSPSDGTRLEMQQQAQHWFLDASSKFGGWAHAAQVLDLKPGVIKRLEDCAFEKGNVLSYIEEEEEPKPKPKPAPKPLPPKTGKQIWKTRSKLKPAVPTRGPLTDAEWKAIEPYVDPPPHLRPRYCRRTIVNMILAKQYKTKGFRFRAPRAVAGNYMHTLKRKWVANGAWCRVVECLKLDK